MAQVTRPTSDSQGIVASWWFGSGDSKRKGSASGPSSSPDSATATNQQHTIPTWMFVLGTILLWVFIATSNAKSTIKQQRQQGMIGDSFIRKERGQDDPDLIIDDDENVDEIISSQTLKDDPSKSTSSSTSTVPLVPTFIDEKADSDLSIGTDQTVSQVYSETATQVSSDSAFPSSSSASDDAPKITKGTIDVGGRLIPYYHCHGKDWKGTTTTMPADETSLILLHGTQYTKEDWKTSHILENICINGNNYNVYALDTKLSTASKQFGDILRTMEDQQLISSLPVHGLVTPSASGKVMADWVNHNDYESINSYVRRWIPIASATALSMKDETLRTMATQKASFQVFAIYGDEDKRGYESMTRLKDFAGATILELPGTHPCYLDSPTEFVNAIVSYLDQDFLQQS